MQELFYKIFGAMERQGPGDDTSTLRALKRIENLPDKPFILDIGCGTGSQTLVVAKHTKGMITALDNHLPFLQKLNEKKKSSGIKNIIPMEGDMNKLPFTFNSFDLIWSEGSAFVMGFRNALDVWKNYLKNNGSIVISELTWFSKNLPEEINQYFQAVYPDINYCNDNVKIIESAGYHVIDYFRLPAASWLEGFYCSMEKIIAELRKVHSEPADAEIYNMLGLEIEMFRKYSEFYGYTFYIFNLPDKLNG